MDLQTLTDEVEAVSAGYARRFGIDRNASWLLLKLQEELGELTQACLRMTGQARGDASPEERAAGFRAELADVLCQTLLVARHHGVDLAAEMEAKWLVWNRPSPS